MSRIQDLISELCPNGVPYVKLGTFASITRGGNFQKKDFCEEGFPCIHYGQIYTRFNLFTDKTLTFIDEDTALKQKFAKPNDIVMAVTSENIDDVCKCVAWLGNDIIVPLPPIEIQNEIVMVLDSLTEYIEELKSELNAEIIARQKQYEYYRDKLLSFKEKKED